MLYVWKTEIRKAFQNRGFYISLLIGGLLSLWHIIKNFELSNELLVVRNTTMTLSNGIVWNTANRVATSVYYNWLGISSMDMIGLIFYFLFPLLAAMPYGWGALVERKNGYCNQLLVRVPKTWITIGKYTAAFLSGGVAVVIPIITDFLFSALRMPMTIPEITDTVATIDETQFGSVLFFSHYILFVIANVGLIFLWGGTMAGLSLAVGEIVRNKVSAVLVPFCFCVFVDLIFEIGILNTCTEWSPIRLFHMVTIRGTSGFVIFGEILAIMLGSVIIFIIGEKRNEGL